MEMQTYIEWNFSLFKCTQNINCVKERAETHKAKQLKTDFSLRKAETEWSCSEGCTSFNIQTFLTFLPAQQRAEKLPKAALPRSSSRSALAPLSAPAPAAAPRPRGSRCCQNQLLRNIPGPARGDFTAQTTETTSTSEAALLWLLAFCTLLSQTAAAPRKIPLSSSVKPRRWETSLKDSLRGIIFHPRASRAGGTGRSCRSLGHLEGAAPNPAGAHRESPAPSFHTSIPNLHPGPPCSSIAQLHPRAPSQTSIPLSPSRTLHLGALSLSSIPPSPSRCKQLCAVRAAPERSRRMALLTRRPRRAAPVCRSRSPAPAWWVPALPQPLAASSHARGHWGRLSPPCPELRGPAPSPSGRSPGPAIPRPPRLPRCAGRGAGAAEPSAGGGSR